MQLSLSFVFDLTALTAIYVFGVLFVTGFVARHSNPVQPTELEPAETEALPVPPPVIESAPVDWSLWGVRELRSATLRAAFSIPSRIAGKVPTKAELVRLYEAGF